MPTAVVHTDTIKKNPTAVFTYKKNPTALYKWKIVKNNPTAVYKFYGNLVKKKGSIPMLILIFYCSVRMEIVKISHAAVHLEILKTPLQCTHKIRKNITLVYTVKP